ncbi:MAG TPA: fibronectin type III domain-containing protein [Verrucomicrobiae bacterium]|nr:fibronectin type III domain-containing protein [Verrucomicrobiae bacterium]
MKSIMRMHFRSALALLCGATFVVPFPTLAVLNGLTVAKSGNDLVLSFPTTSTNFYGVQTSADLAHPWTNFQPGIRGDGTVISLRLTNAISAAQGFYQVVLQPSPTRLLLSQSAAFAILGYDCGGIQEQVSVTGFDPVSGYPTGNVDLSTSCSTGRAGSPPSVHRASASVVWDFAGNVLSATTPGTGTPPFTGTDVYGDIIYNTGANAYLIVPVPGAPAGVTAIQSGDQFQVSWAPQGVNPSAVTLSTLTATPLNPPGLTLTTTVTGAATTGVIASLQPQTTYQVTVVNTTIGGLSPGSTPLSVTTVPASLPPSAPSGVTADWANLDPTTATDTLVANWQAAVPGDSPIDQYQVTIIGSDGGGTFTQTVSGTTLTASFNVDYIPNWSVTVQAHNAVGWGSASPAVSLGGL